MAILPPVPMRSPVLEPANGSRDPFVAVLHREIVRFLNELRKLIGSVFQVIVGVDVSGQSAAIVPTSLGTFPAGTYRCGYQLQVTQAATTSSSAQVTFNWTFNSTAQSQVFTAVTGNTLASQTSDEILFTIDSGTAISYSVAYSSVGATSMMFSLQITVEEAP